MRNPRCLLVLQCYRSSQRHRCTPLSHCRTYSPIASLSSPTVSRIPKFAYPFFRTFSSQPALEERKLDDVVAIGIFSRGTAFDEIKKELELNNVVISHELVLKVLGSSESSPDVAKRFFGWVSSAQSERLSSKSYNSMLGILGINGLIQEFWDMIETMKRKGYGVSKHLYVKILEKFEKEGLKSDVVKLKELYANGSNDNSVEKVCSRVCKLIRNELWDNDVEKRIRELNIEFSSNLVKMVLENLSTDPKKALIFFRWVEDGSLFRHDEQTYNVIATVLGREDCIDRFWNIADEMGKAGYEMEMDTYVKVLRRFCKRKMYKDAADLYEFAMGGANKPLVHDCTFLLKKVVAGKSLDMGLFSRILRVFLAGGNVLTNSMVHAVLKSLNSVDRLEDCNKIMKTMEEHGYKAKASLQSKVAYQLSCAGKKDEASEFMDNLKASGCEANSGVCVSLIKGHCIAGDLGQASECLQKMVDGDRENPTDAICSLELLVKAFCRKNKAKDAFKLLSDMIREHQIKPNHTTYKALITKLLVQGAFSEALSLLNLMKNHGFPPFLDPFMEYISKSGTPDDAFTFLKAMTVKKFPSRPVFVRVFESFMKARKHNEAQDLLSKCPQYIRNDHEVLTLLCTMKPQEVAAATATVG